MFSEHRARELGRDFATVVFHRNAALCFVQLKVTRSSHDLGWEHHKATILFLLLKFEKCENVVAFSNEPVALRCLEPAKFDRIDNEKFLWLRALW